MQAEVENAVILNVVKYLIFSGFPDSDISKEERLNQSHFG